MGSDSLQCLEACEDVSHLSGNSGDKTYPRPKIVVRWPYIFCCAYGYVRLIVVNPHPTAPHLAVNIMNIILYRRGNAYQKIGYLLSIPRLSACSEPSLTMCTVQCTARVCDHFDNESTNTPSRAWYVPTTLIPELMTK